MAASGDLDAANADDGDPSSSNWRRTGLDPLRGHVTEAASRPLPEPSVDNEGWQFVRKAAPQSPPRQQELESDDAEWQRPTRIEADPVVHDNVETTEFVTEAPESSSFVALKRRRYTQTTIGFDTGTPLESALKFKDLDIVDAAIRALGDIVTKSSVWHERFKELQQEIHKTSLEHQGLFDVRWLSRGDAVQWLCRVLGAAVMVFLEYNHKMAAVVQSLKFHFCLYFLADLLAEINALNRFFQRRKVDITLMHHEVDRTIGCTRQSYVEYDKGFEGGVSKLLSPFIPRMANGKRKITVDGVDAEGEPTSHEIELSEEPLPGHEYGGSMADCIKLCKAFTM
ncbi:unnamed protein product [Closterium sp. NIES-53]